MSTEAFIEYSYRYQERLGLMTDGAEPTPEQMEQAKQEAEAKVKELGL